MLFLNCLSINLIIFDSSKGGKSKNIITTSAQNILNKTLISVFAVNFLSTLAKSTKCSYNFPCSKVFIKAQYQILSFKECHSNNTSNHRHQQLILAFYFCSSQYFISLPLLILMAASAGFPLVGGLGGFAHAVISMQFSAIFSQIVSPKKSTPFGKPCRVISKTHVVRQTVFNFINCYKFCHISKACTQKQNMKNELVERLIITLSFNADFTGITLNTLHFFTVFLFFSYIIYTF